MKPGRLAVLATSGAFLLAGCGATGLVGLPLPGTEGRGDGSYVVTIMMPQVGTITPNSPVQVDDVTVGTIDRIELDGWNAKVTVRIDGDVVLPSDVTAEIGQTSVLGSQHIALRSPASTADTAPAGATDRLVDGAVIPIERAMIYPTTEQTLSSLSVVLNGGGIDQLDTVTRELYAALDGTSAQARSLLEGVDTLVSTLDDQRTRIVGTIDGLDRLSVTFAEEDKTLADALDRISPALTVLADDRAQITAALAAAARFGSVAEAFSDESRQSLIDNLTSLRTALKYLADSGQDLPASIDTLATFPIPQSAIEKGVRGDYTNLFLVLDLTVERLRSGFLAGTPLGPAAVGPEAMIGAPPVPMPVNTNPLIDPLGDLQRAVEDGFGDIIGSLAPPPLLPPPPVQPEGPTP
ncbi:MAG: MCE family protein [Rhodococcus sp. (in: high G+C Gram-positive bacteria)]